MPFAGITGDFTVLQADHVIAAGTRVGEPITHGLPGLVLASGPMHHADGILGTVIAFLGPTWRITAALAFGDTIAAGIAVRAVKETSGPHRGLATLPSWPPPSATSARGTANSRR